MSNQAMTGDGPVTTHLENGLRRVELTGYTIYVKGMNTVRSDEFTAAEHRQIAEDMERHAAALGDAPHVLARGRDDGAVHAVAVLLHVELAGVERGVVEAVDAEEAADEAAGLGALEGHGDFLALIHLGPRDGERHRLAALECHEAVRGGGSHWAFQRTRGGASPS